jgi:hypothetical protein
LSFCKTVRGCFKRRANPPEGHVEIDVAANFVTLGWCPDCL